MSFVLPKKEYDFAPQTYDPGYATEKQRLKSFEKLRSDSSTSSVLKIGLYVLFKKRAGVFY